jgi:hypothetical protein
VQLGEEIMTGRDLKAVFITLGLLALGAVLIVVVAPNFFAREKPYPERTPTLIANQVSPVVSNTPIVTPSPLPTVAPTLANTTLASVTASPTNSPPSPTIATNGLPGVKQIPFKLPEGQSPSRGALSCPNPLPLEKIRTDYFAYWEAVKKAHKERNPASLQPFVDQEARDGENWKESEKFIQDLIANNIYLEYQIEHSRELQAQINPYSYSGKCFVLLYDSPKVTTYAKKVGSNDLINDKQPLVRSYPADTAFIMLLRDNRWIFSNMGGAGMR